MIYRSSGEIASNTESVFILQQNNPKASLLFKCGGITSKDMTDALFHIATSTQESFEPIVFETWIDHLMRFDGSSSDEWLSLDD
jgi:hypothetical protein